MHEINSVYKVAAVYEDKNRQQFGMVLYNWRGMRVETYIWYGVSLVYAHQLQNINNWSYNIDKNIAETAYQVKPRLDNHWAESYISSATS